MEWTNELIFEFLNLYQNEPILWNAATPEHKNKNDAFDAWNRIKTQLKDGTVSVTELKKKRENLMSTYRRQRKKVKDSIGTGSEADEVYKPEWPFYHIMSTFLDDIYKPKITKNSEELQHRIDNRPQIKRERTPLEINKGVKRKANLVDTEIEFMNTCSQTLKRNRIGEYEALSIAFTKKLERMNNIQALYAESLITSVLRKGILNQLTEETNICDRQCKESVVSSGRRGRGRSPPLSSESEE